MLFGSHILVEETYNCKGRKIYHVDFILNRFLTLIRTASYEYSINVKLPGYKIVIVMRKMQLVYCLELKFIVTNTTIIIRIFKLSLG